MLFTLRCSMYAERNLEKWSNYSGCNLEETVVILKKLSKVISKELSSASQSTLNIVGAMLVVIINTSVNFFLSPFITEHLGVEANGYITLANNFISYFGLITTALDSMCGRFMLIAIRRNDYKEANEYYTSVLFGDWMLAAVLFVPVFVLIVRLENFIQINHGMLDDVTTLFALVFLNFFLAFCLPKWANSTYSTNRLYLRSVKTAITTIIRAVLIYVAYRYLPAFVFYVALAGIVATIINLLIEYYYKTVLLPELQVKKEYFDLKKIKILLSSGIWNTVSLCGNILLEGLDILIANIFINPVMSGILALSKIIPNMINQIVGTIGTTFGPRLTALYADENYDGMVQELKTNIKIVSTIANIPIGGTFVLGAQFFALWVPSQNAKQLSVLASLTLAGMLFSGVSNCLLNVFTATNKLKLNSLTVIVSGLLNVSAVYILLGTSKLGVYAIAGVSSVVTILRIFLFVAPYAAKCINQNAIIFIAPLLKAGLNVMIPILVGLIIRKIPGDGWIVFFVRCILVGLITVSIDFYVVLNSSERCAVMRMAKRKK